MSSHRSGAQGRSSGDRRVTVATIRQPLRTGLRTPLTWGIGVGVLQAASPLAFWWLDATVVYALGLVVIASVYIGFAVADGRAFVIAAESTPSPYDGSLQRVGVARPRRRADLKRPSPERGGAAPGRPVLR